jgi:hypothetical protein
MGEGAVGKLAGDVEACASTVEGLGVTVGEFAVDEDDYDLDLAEGFGFGFALGEVGVELLHEEGSEGVADVPEGGEGVDAIAGQVGGDDTAGFGGEGGASHHQFDDTLSIKANGLMLQL